MSLWDTYQPIALGFGAAFLGLLANSALEWFKQSLTRKNDARALRSALIAELNSNANNMRGRLDRKNVVGDHAKSAVMMLPLGAHTSIYDAAIPRLGLLNDNEVASVIEAYDFIINAPRNLILPGELKGEPYYPYVEISVRYESAVVAMDKRSMELIEKAVSMLSRKPRALIKMQT